MRSLRKNLLLWLLPATFLVGVMASAGTYWGAYLQLQSLLDDQLRYIAQHVQTTDKNNGISLNQLTQEQRIAEHEKGDEVLFEIWEGRQRVFSTHPEIKLPAPVKVGIADEAWHGDLWHTLVIKKSHEKWIRIGQAQNARFEALAGLSINLFWPVVAMLPLMALFLWFGIGYGLRPLVDITKALGERNAKSMTPIEPPHPLIEIQPFVDALNDLLTRLNSTFQQQERFIADAAHELRTPVMGLQIESDVLMRETETEARQKSLEQLRQGISRLAHLIQQLLTLAKTDSDEAQNNEESVSLSGLARQVISEHHVFALQRNIDLGLGDCVDVDVKGHQQALKIVLDNLVDNAIRYLPEGGRIDVSVRKERDAVLLEVSDDGDGIPKSEQEKVFQRFYRGTHQDIPGSGLGLNIVKQITDSHNAQLLLGEGLQGKGLSVQVRFYINPR